MLTHAIIKNFNVFEDTRFDFLKRVEFLPVYEFDFHTTEEWLHYGIDLQLLLLLMLDTAPMLIIRSWYRHERY